MKDNKNTEMVGLEMNTGKKNGSAKCGFVLSIAKGNVCCETRVTNVLIIQSYRMVQYRHHPTASSI